MAIGDDATWQLRDSVPVVEENKGQSSSRLRSNPQHSDIRELDSPRIESMKLEPIRGLERSDNRPKHAGNSAQASVLDEVGERYGKRMPNSHQVLSALRVGALEQAVELLLNENLSLNEELEAGRGDYAAILAMNRELEEQSQSELAKADDLRITLLDDLEQAQAACMELEMQLAQARRDSEIELDEMRQLRDLLELENFELRNELESLRRSA